MKVATTSERLKQILSERHIRQLDIIEAAKPYSEKYNVKLNKNDLSQYVSGKTEPGQSKLSILGMALNVNEAWLMGYDVPIERKNEETSENIFEKSEISYDGDMPFKTLTSSNNEFGISEDQVNTYKLEVEFPAEYKVVDYQGIIELLEIKINAQQKV